MEQILYMPVRGAPNYLLFRVTSFMLLLALHLYAVVIPWQKSTLIHKRDQNCSRHGLPLCWSTQNAHNLIQRDFHGERYEKYFVNFNVENKLEKVPREESESQRETLNEKVLLFITYALTIYESFTIMLMLCNRKCRFSLLTRCNYFVFRNFFMPLKLFSN